MLYTVEKHALELIETEAIFEDWEIGITEKRTRWVEKIGRMVRKGSGNVGTGSLYLQDEQKPFNRYLKV